MRQKLLEFVKRKTSVDIIINTLGNYLNIFFIALFALILVRVMTPIQYGVLSILLAIVYGLANILDFGVTANIYSTLPLIIDKKKEEAFKFIKSNFVYQSFLSLIIIVLLVFFFPQLDKYFFKTAESRFVLNMTAISTLFIVWQNYILNIFFASKKFLQANIYLNLSNIVKALTLLILIYTNQITVSSIIFLFAIIGPVSFLIFLSLGKKEAIISFMNSKISKADFKVKYTLPYFAATQFFGMGLRMDLFMLSFFGLRAGVGYYGLAQKVVLTIFTTIISITQVISPSFSKIKTKKEAKSLGKTGFVYLLLPTILYILLFVIPNKVYNFVFTSNFAQTAKIIKSLIIPYILFTIGQLPHMFLLYVARKPSYILVSNIVFFIGMVIGSYLLVPKFGVFAPAIVIVISITMSVTIQVFASIYEYKKLPE